MLEIEEVQAFLSVVELKSVTRAAATLYVAPSTISKRLARLEKRASEPLFERCGVGMLVTSRAGALLPAFVALTKAHQHATNSLDLLASARLPSERSAGKVIAMTRDQGPPSG